MADIIERLRIESQREPNKPIWRDAVDEIEALRAEVERLRNDGASAIRWAPGSAYWSEVLVELFGPDARKGIDVLEARWRKEIERAERLAEALRLALDSHGVMLMTDPPQDAWKVRRVEEIGRALLRDQEEGSGAFWGPLPKVGGTDWTGYGG